MAWRRLPRRALALALLVLQIQSFQLPAPKLHAAETHRSRRPHSAGSRRPPAAGPASGFASGPAAGRRRRTPCAPLAAAPYDAAEALYAYIASPSPVHDALHAAGTAYASLIDAHPLATKSVTNALVGVTGDAIAQRGQAYDRQRAARYALKGLGGGLLWAFYFDFADAFAVNSVDGPAARVALQMALEQFFWVPLYVAFYDLPFASRLNGVPARRVPNVVRDSYVSTLVASAKLWTPANLLVYSTPVEYRLLVSNIFDLAWNTVNSDISASCSEECPVGDGPPGASRMCPPDRPPSAIPTSR